MKQPYQPDLTSIQVSNGKVLIPFSSGYATGWIEGPPVLARGPIARPTFKIPMNLWRQCVSFLNDIFAIKGWEAHLMFYRRESDGDLAIFCPVQTGGPAATHSVDCDDNERALAYFAREGYDCVGSVHSHCNMSAFQSGTDKDDEFGNADGFHITIGKMKDEIMDVHCRSIVTLIDPEMKKKAERIQVPFVLQDFVDGIPDYENAPFPIPSKIRTELIKHCLASSDIDDEYNPEWVDKIVEAPKPAPAPAVQQQYFGHVYTPSKSYREIGETAWIAGAKAIWNGHRYLLPGDDGYDELAEVFLNPELDDDEVDQLRARQTQQALYNME